jgi:SAM-dependent methyltransferase
MRVCRASLPESETLLDREHLLELHRLEAGYWWHVNKRRIVLHLLRRAAKPPGRLLDVGCGGALLAATLARKGWTVSAADLAPEALAFATEHGIAETHRFDAGARWPLADESFQAVVMTDLLEHLDDDDAALAEARRVLAPGGAIVVTVPAHAFLFSRWDSMLGHRRRYSRKGLRAAAARGGLRVERLTWWNAAALPPALVMRRKEGPPSEKERHAEFVRVPRPVNGLLKFWGWMEDAWLNVAGIPLGLSLAAVLRKDPAAQPAE